MISLNRVILAGALVKAPELKTTATNRKLATFTIAVTDHWRDRDGEMAQRSTFVKVICWGNLAGNVCRYLNKGKYVMIEGKLSGDSYTDSNGKQHNHLKVDASSVVFCEKTGGSKSIE